MALLQIQSNGDSGIVRDVLARELPVGAASNAKNVRFRDGFVSRINGHVGVYGTPTVVPYSVMPFTTQSGRVIVYAGLQQIYSVTGTTHTVRTRTSGGAYNATEDNDWTGGVIGGIAYLNNPQDPPQYWDGVSGNFAVDPTWPNAKCKAFRVFRNYGIAMNVTKVLTNYPHMVKWSAPANPGALPSSWDETNPTTRAGETDLSDNQSIIVDGLGLDDQFVIYKESAYYLMRFIGGNEVFSFQRVSDVAGMLARNCAADTPLGHVVLTQGDVILHNGGEPQSIVQGRMRKWLFNQIDSTNYKRSFVAQNPDQKEVWICFPASGQAACTLALIWSWDKNTFTVRDLPSATCGAQSVIDVSVNNSWNSQTETWDESSRTWGNSGFAPTASRLIVGTTEPKIQLTDQSRKFDGASFTAFFEREGMDLGNPSTRKMVKSIRPRFLSKSGTVINIYVGHQESLNEGVMWEGPYQFTSGQMDRVTMRVSGRFIGVKFETTGTQGWELQSYDIEYEELGTR